MFDRAVINAGPLVALSLLDKLDLLPALFAEIWVPQRRKGQVLRRNTPTLQRASPGASLASHILDAPDRIEGADERGNAALQDLTPKPPGR